MSTFRNILLSVICLGLISCESQSQNTPNANVQLHPDFGSYWYQGKAELSSFKLTQARYGELREGEAVLIFVTEDFSKSKQVKLDDPKANKADAVKVLKLNHTRNFNTGLYPYSMMESVFTPVYRNDNDKTLKVTTSSQEWCGHTFSQLNLKNKKYKVSSKSYFESDGDENIEVNAVLLESELMNLIRLNPEYIPLGTVEIIPNGIYARLSHKGFKPQEATISSSRLDDQKSQLIIEYKSIKRNVKLTFGSRFPCEILGWEEEYQSGFGSKAKMMTTTAERKKKILLDYWTKNHLSDSTYRRELMLK
ncbi:MAG: hypothetical protein JXQ96_00125 [Cyclobacteriaceae bacterium]